MIEGYTLLHVNGIPHAHTLNNPSSDGYIVTQSIQWHSPRVLDMKMPVKQGCIYFYISQSVRIMGFYTQLHVWKCILSQTKPPFLLSQTHVMPSKLAEAIILPHGDHCTVYHGEHWWSFCTRSEGDYVPDLTVLWCPSASTALHTHFSPSWPHTRMYTTSQGMFSTLPTSMWSIEVGSLILFLLSVLKSW